VQNLPKFLGGECECQPYGCIFSNAGPWNKGETVEINPELLKQTLILNNEQDDKNNELDNLPDELPLSDEDDDDRERLAELSKQLNEGMKLSTGHQANAKFKSEQDDIDDGQTPINTQENVNLI
jgi:hypothetical protein